MKLGNKIIWQITIIENSGVCDYKINMDGTTVIIQLFLSNFNRINEYKTLALQALNGFKYQRLKVV